MFEHIHFFTSDTTLINKRNFPLVGDSEILSPDALTSRSIAFGSLDKSSEYNIPGHTSILFPPCNTDFHSQHLLIPQGFFLCEYWKGYFTKRNNGNYHSYMLLYTISGSGVLEYENKRYQLKAHDIFFIDCRKCQHYYTEDTVWKHVDIHFFGDYADDLYQEYCSISNTVINCGPSALMLQHLEELATIWDTTTIYPTLSISNKLVQIITELLTLSKKKALPEKQIDTFSFVIKYIENHFAESLTLDFLANFASMSKYHFSRAFKKYTGSPPIQYVIQLRVAHAKDLLMNTNLSIKQIAFTTGFTDINNFIKQFKNIEQMTPSAYRNHFK